MADSPESPKLPAEDMRPEYDFRSMRGVVRGKYAARYRERLRVVRLEADVAAAFADEAAVNAALPHTSRGGPRSRFQADQAIDSNRQIGERRGVERR